MQLVSVSNDNLFVVSISILFYLLETFGSKWCSPFSGPIQKSILLVVTIAGWAFHLQPLAPLALYPQNWQSIRYLPTRIFKFFPNPPAAIRLVIILISGVVDLIFSYTAIFAGYTVIAIYGIYIAKMKFWLKSLTHNIVAKGMDKSVLTIVVQFRTLYALNQICRASYNSEFLFLLWNISYAMIVSLLAQCFRYNVHMPLRAAVISIPCVFLALFIHRYVATIGGEVLEYSQNCLLVMSTGSIRISRRSAKSCRELRMYFGSVFYFEKSTFAVFLDAAVNNATAVSLGGF